MMREWGRRKIKAIVECYDELELFKNMLIDEFSDFAITMITTN